MNLGAALQSWHRAVVVPRWRIVRLLPRAGKGLVGLLLIVNVAVGLLPVVFVLATSALVGKVPAAVAGGTEGEAFGELVGMFLLAAGCFLAQQSFMPLQSVLGARMTRKIDGVLRDQAIGVVLQPPGLGPMEDEQTLAALSEATRLFETGQFTPGTACSGLLALVARYLRLLALLGIVATVASWGAALALGATTLMFRHGQRGGLRKYSAVWREVASESRRSDYLRELATGSAAAKEIRIFGIVDWLSQRYAESFRAAYEPVARRRREIYLRPYRLFTLLGLLASAGVAAWIASLAARGSMSLVQLALGLQATVAALLLGEFYPESDVPTQFGMNAASALDEVRLRLGAAAPRRQLDFAGVPRGLPSRFIRFEQVDFRYPGAERSVLNGLTLELPVGKCTAVVGINGAGKTTLVKLLTRLYEPTGGVILADGIDIASLEPSAWRRQVSVIFQDFVRYELSAAENVALGAAHVPADRRALEEAARSAGILGAFAELPLGLDTPLGRAYAGGIDLSGGQWQRVAIARSLYALRAGGARLLILDEPTSALDVRAEVAFFDRFVELTRGVTSLLISHRFSSVRRADHIVVLDGGRVSEQGSHAELMAANGHYAELFRLQAERFVDAAESDSSRVWAAPGAPHRAQQPEGATS